MRNLRKYFAVFVAVALLVTAIAPAFAADTATTAPASAPAMTDAKTVETLGMLKGEGGVVTDAYLKTSVTRIQAAIMFLRLKGLESAALAFTGKDNFEDADKVDWDGGKAVLAYLKANKDLGWLGDGVNFDPNGIITAQGYYKILLVSLGYVEGTDFKYEDTLAFAESKGLKAAAKADPFTISDVATATVEALKATKADGKATLLQSLIDAKAIDTAKAQAAGLVSSVTSKFDLSNGAKALTVKFDAAPVDAAKVTFTTTRDGIAISFAFTQDATDKAKFVYSATTNLVAGEYKVAVKNDTTDLGSKSVKIENEKLAKIEMLSKNINRRSDFEGIAYYKVINQYGEDVTKNSIAANIVWNSSLGTDSVSADKGTLKFTKGNDTDTTYMSRLKDYTTTPVVITAYDTDSSISFNESLTVSTTVGDIQSIKLLGISNADGKKTVEKATSDIFYIDYEIKDSAGNLVTDYQILSNTSAFTLSPKAAGESSIIYAQVIQDPNDNKKAKFQLKNEQITSQIAGTQTISAIALTSGKSSTLNVEVVEGSALKEFIIQKPSTDVAVNDGKVTINYVALDSNGAQITDYSKIKTKVTFSGINSSSIYEVQNPDGSYGLFMDFGSTKQTFTVTATVTTTTSSKMSQMTLTTKDAAYPYDITAINKTDSPQGVVYGAEVEVHPGRFTVVDQYGRPINLRFAQNFSDKQLTDITVSGILASPGAPVMFYEGLNDKLYFVAMSSSDESVMQVNRTSSVSTHVYGVYNSKNYAIISGNRTSFYTPGTDVNGSGTKSTSLNFSLRSIPKSGTNASGANIGADTANTVALLMGRSTEVDSFSYTVYNVDRKDITKYEFDAVTATLYASGTSTVMGLGATYTRGDYENVQNTGRDRAWEQEFKLRGYYNGIRTLLPTSDAVNFAVGDSAKFAINVTATAQSVYVLPKAWSSDQAATASTKLTATVKGYNNVYSQASIDVKAAQASPLAASVSVNRNDFAPVKNIGTDYYTVTLAEFNIGINNRYLVRYLANGLNTWTRDTYGGTGSGVTRQSTIYPQYDVLRSYLYFGVVDQYGKQGLNPASIQVVRDRAGVSTPLTGVIDAEFKLTLAGGDAPAANDNYKITIVAPGGAYKTVTLEVK